jgi:dolichol-phosphate mannosyltransferase
VQITNSPNPHLSIVIPVYACADCLGLLYSRLVDALTTITEDFEIILVNDASPDRAWERIRVMAEKDSRVKGINFPRNFGQHHAITAGLDFAGGDWVVVMDCDLQDQPQEIPKLYTKALEGFDVVYGVRQQRQDSYLKKLGSDVFAKVLTFFMESERDNSTCNFSIVSNKVVGDFRKLREQNPSYPLMINWLGFKTTKITVEHSSRSIGKSSYNLRRLINLAFDAIISHSNKPLRLSISFGFLMAFLSISYGLYLVWRYFFMHIPPAGWTSVMVSIYFVGGLLFANLGILGLYLGRVFDEAKGRPLYAIDSTVNISRRPRRADDE